MHPSHTSGDESAHPRTLADTPYAELAVTTNFTFLRGASHPEEYVQRAAELGYRAIAITDHNTLGGVVRAHITAKELRIPLVVGARLILQSRDWFSLLVFPTNRDAYGRLCRLLTLGKRRAAKGDCLLTLEDVVAHSAELLVVIVPNAALPALIPNELGRLRDVFDDDRLSMAITRLFEPDEVDRNATLAAWADAASIPLVAVNDAHYHDPSRRLLQDVLTCIRHGCTIHEAGSRLFRNGERYLKPAAELRRQAVRRVPCGAASKSPSARPDFISTNCAMNIRAKSVRTDLLPCSISKRSPGKAFASDSPKELAASCSIRFTTNCA
ncbi:MAG: PHP domain-containing protein [Phycisphaerales bacterium]|nr:PHP domain-containing protein [Phycisphaerales bacterium]